MIYEDKFMKICNLKTQLFHSKLYRLEQITIGITLICFLCFGIIQSSFSFTSEVSTTPSAESPTSDRELANNDSDTNDTPMVPEDSLASADNEEVIIDESETIDNSENINETSVPNEKPNIPSQTESSSQNKTPSQTESPNASASTPVEPEKVWVPPVYETIHHDAVYETVSIVICNYCAEEFESTSDFQIHKAANGG